MRGDVGQQADNVRMWADNVAGQGELEERNDRVEQAMFHKSLANGGRCTHACTHTHAHDTHTHARTHSHSHSHMRVVDRRHACIQTCTATVL
eukprot:281420-Rhodomonas_salina.1